MGIDVKVPLPNVPLSKTAGHTKLIFQNDRLRNKLLQELGQKWNLLPQLYDPQFYGLEVSLSNIFISGLFCSNNRMEFFSKTERKNITANIKGTIRLCRSRETGVRGVLKFVTCLQILFFKNQ